MPTAYQKAVQLLASRPHFRREMELKLTSRSFPAEEIGAALDRLTSEGYLDDRSAAEGLIRSRLSRGEGRLRLAAELGRRGAPSEIAAAALAALLPEDDFEATQDAAARWARGGRKDPAALARHLARKGFSRRAIVRVLREEGSGEVAGEDDGMDE
jgi:regulatory protein